MSLANLSSAYRRLRLGPAIGVSRPAAVAATVALHLAAIAGIYLTESTLYGRTLHLLAWVFLNCCWLMAVRRPGVAAALSLVMIQVLILVSQFKFDILWMTVSFFDLLLVDADTIVFLLTIFPQLRPTLIVVTLVLILALVLLWRFDPFRVGLRTSIAVSAACLAAMVGLAMAVPEEPWEPFQPENYVSKFVRSGVTQAPAFALRGWLDADLTVKEPLRLAADAPCQPAGRPPHIIMVLDESSFDIGVAPGIKTPPDYDGHFRSFDGKTRSLVVEASGGPTWYTEYNVLNGLSARSFGRFMFYVTRIAADRVERGLPQSLRRCGYRTFSLYPAYGSFLGARRFQASAGIGHFIDAKDMGAREVEPDHFYYDQAVKLIGRERGHAPLFLFVYTAANHFPWTSAYRPDLTPNWRNTGNEPEVDEYIRRQSISAQDYAGFTARLAKSFPDESFLIVRFGDHQPSIAARLIDPTLDPAAIARRVMAADPRYFSTYYAIDAVNFAPADMSSALETLDAPYLPLVVQEAAGLPLDASFAEQKKVMERCRGLFFFCADGAEARRFNRLLIDAGLIKGL